MGFWGAHSPAPAAGQWWHIAYTYDGAAARVYVNGVEESVRDPLSLNTHVDCPINIGTQNNDAAGNPSAQYFSGSVLRVRIHDGVLSPDDILGNYNAEKDTLAMGPGAAVAMFPNDVAATASGTIETAGSAVLRSLTLDKGVTLTTLAPNEDFIGFQQTIFGANGAGNYLFDTPGELRLGQLDDQGQAGLIVLKTGGDALVLNETTLAGDADEVTFQVSDGALGIVGENLGLDPLGGASVHVLNPAALVFSSKNGNVDVGTDFDIDAAVTIEARRAYGGTAENVAVALTGAVDVAAGETLTTATADGYTLVLNTTVTGAAGMNVGGMVDIEGCLLYTSPSPRDRTRSRMPSSA